MSSKQQILYEIETYDTGKLTEFLEANGFAEFTQVVQIKGIDGSQFLKLKEYEILSWKPHITLQQVRKIWAFITHFKENPEKYVIPKLKIPRPNITRQQLQYLCNDEQIINKLHNLLQERDLQQATVHHDSSDTQESFSSEDETYANQDAVKNPIPNRSSLHKLSFKDPTKDLKPMKKVNQNFDATPDTDSDEIYENATNLPQSKQNSEKQILPPPQTKVEEEVQEIYENRPLVQAKKEIGIPVLPRTPLTKSSKSEEPQVLQRPPLPISSKPHDFDLNKKITSTPAKLKPLPQIPQNEQNQPTIPSRSNKLNQTVSPNKNNSQFLGARSHLETVFSGRTSPRKEELEEYLEPVPAEEEQMYEPVPTFEENQSNNKFRSGAIQALPLPPLPTLPLPPFPAKFDLKSPEVNSKNRSGQIEIASKSSNKREIQSRTLPKPPPSNFEQAPQARTLPRPPRKLPNFNNHLNAQSEDDLETLLCYRYTDRSGSEMLLTEELGDGAYLFRPSKKYYCTLSVRCENKIYHVGIKQNNGGQLECLSSGKHVLFDNLKEICQHFKANPLRMIDNYNNYKSILLRDVLPRDRT